VKATPGELLGAPDLPQVRIADCRCILSVDIPPVGYRFKATEFGDVRVSVYGCREHTHLSALTSPTPVVKAKRAGKSKHQIQ
jgi:hypothetical protein